jgi:hypothetical protein
MADDRFEAYRAMGVRYRLKSKLTELGTQPSELQVMFVQDCIELAKLSPDSNTDKIMQDAFERTRR